MSHVTFLTFVSACSERVQGLVVHIRRVSRSLLFFDLFVNKSNADCDAPTSGVAERLCVMCKIGHLTQTEVRLCRSCIHLGDCVSVAGSFESSSGGPNVFVACSVPVVTQTRPKGKHFVPIPDTRAKTKSSGDAVSDTVTQLPAGICKAWFFSGSCSSQQSCPYDHPPITKVCAFYPTPTPPPLL